MSDSDSEYDDIDVGLTSVLLGFGGKEAILSDLSTDGNHIGGVAVWFGTNRSPIKPPAELLECKVCAKPLNLLAQLSCPLPNKFYDRVLYVLACDDPNCRRKQGSVRAIRGVNNSEEVQNRIAEELKAARIEDELVPETKLGDSLFNSNSANPFANGNGNPFANGNGNPFANGNGNPFASDNAAASAATNKSTQQHNPPHKRGPSKKSLRSVSGKYICKLLEVEEEYLENPDDKPLDPNIKIEEMDTQPDVESENAGGSSGEALAELETNGSPVFAHFMDIVESNPEQVLRYEIGLKPLLYSGTDDVAQALPTLGDLNKRLELQLMPHLIAELETVDMLLDGMEWGTIFVACDADDALPALDSNGVGYVEEWVGVQWE